VTHLREVISKIEERWSEGEELFRHSGNTTTSYQRSVVNGAVLVLLVAHFESSLKEICEAIINDLNRSGFLNTFPKESKELYIRNLIDFGEIKKESTEGRKKIEYITNWVFSDQIILDAHKFTNTEGNPTPEVVRKLSRQFGVSGFFSSLSTTEIDYNISTSNNMDFAKEIKRLKTYFKRTTSNYPYTMRLQTVGFMKYNKNNSALESNLNEILRRRNIVAHGGVLGEIISDTDIIQAVVTLRAITLYFIAALGMRLSHGSNL
jgi:RiboL-PSP-HEPN